MKREERKEALKESLKESGGILAIVLGIVIIVLILATVYTTILYFVTPEECREAPTWLLHVLNYKEAFFIVFGSTIVFWLVGVVLEILGILVQRKPRTQKRKKPDFFSRIKVPKTIGTILDYLFKILSVVMATTFIIILILEIFKAHYCL
jgi:uncharacterized membrane protein